MENDKIKRFYIMPEVWVTVTQSQVFNWVKLVNEEGISTDCISITDKKNTPEDVRQIEVSMKGRFIEVHDHKRLLLSDFFIILVLFKFYLLNVFKYEKIIFQTRLGTIGYVYMILGWFPRVKLIFEGRGAGNEESSHANKRKKQHLKMKIKNYFSEINEKLLLTKSDKVFCVSEALMKYYTEKFNLSTGKFSVFPGAADADLFFYDEPLRNTTRKELNLNSGDILIVYSGRLEMKWEIPDKIFEFFKYIHNKDSKFKLLLLTPDIEIANTYINNSRLKESTFVKKVDLIEVNRYLNAADIGLLLREDIPMNNVASPTKFAEYIMSGLPVMISFGVHDFAQMVAETKFGVVLKELDRISEKEYKTILNSLTIERKKMAEWGSNNLSKRVFIEKYVNVLKDV